VEWYKKAMNNGMILNSPTIFGASGNHLLGGGEAGPEAVVGVSSLMDMIQSAVANTQLAADAGNITIPVYIGGNLIDEMIVTAQQRRALRSGGRA
jgi:phage-related minor tail protein